MALTEFYSPQHVQLPEGDRVHLRSLRDISGLQNCIITGTAGQGKSVLFRYLALQEVLEKRLPVFVELRNLSHKSDVWELISDELHALGFDKHEDLLKYVLQDTHTTVFLDAFDEVPPSVQTRTRAEIEDLTRMYPKTRFLISSRPSLQIESSPFFRVARLSYLQPEEVPAVLKRMCRDTDDPATVECEVKKSNHHLTELLNTPLMVALLLLHYRLSRKFPETEQAFFDDLFDVLLRRHDQTKGYIRKRYSEATESELSDVFGYICFLCRKRGETDVTRRSLVETASAAIEYFQIKLDAAGVVDDIIHGTNLILEEGGGCRFAHKSIQEFYGAAFLVRQPETQVAGFLAGKVKQWDMWAQFLRFTEILDRHKFLQYFLVPHIGFLAYADGNKRSPMGWIPSKKAFERVFGRDSIGVLDGAAHMHGCAYTSTCYLLRGTYHVSAFWEALRLVNWSDVKTSLNEKDRSLVRASKPGGEEFEEFPMAVLLRSKAGDLVRDALMIILKSIIPEILEAYSFLNFRANNTDLFS